MNEFPILDIHPSSRRTFLNRIPILCSSICALTLLLPNPDAAAGSATWTGTGTTSYWGDAANWNPSSTFPNGIGDAATLPNLAQFTILLADSSGNDASFTLGTLNFNATAEGFTIDNVPGGTGRLIFDVSAGSTFLLCNAFTSAPLLINAGITLNDNLQTQTASTGIRRINGQISSGAGLVTGLIVNGASGGQSPTFSNPPLQLAAANNYTGATIINGTTNAGASPAGGYLQLFGGSDRLPVGTDLTVNGSAITGTVYKGGTFDLNGFDQTVASLAGSAGATPGRVVNTAANTVDTLTVGGAASTTFNGVIANGGAGNSGVVNLVRSGSGTLTLSGISSYTGTTTVSGGILSVTGAISGSSSILLNNAGTLYLGGSSNAGAGRIADNAAVSFGAGSGPATLLLVSDDVTQIVETVGPLSLGANAILDFGKGSAGGVISFGDSSATFGSGGLSIWNWSGSVGGGGVDQVRFAGALSDAQLLQIQFYSDAGATPLGSARFVGGGGEIAPVPEPGSWMLCAAALGMVRWRRARSRQ